MDGFQNAVKVLREREREINFAPLLPLHGIIVDQNSIPARGKTSLIIHEAICASVISTSSRRVSPRGAVAAADQISISVSLPHSTCARPEQQPLRLSTCETSYPTDVQSAEWETCLYLAGMRCWYYLMLALSHAKKNMHYTRIAQAGFNSFFTAIWMFCRENIVRMKLSEK